MNDAVDRSEHAEACAQRELAAVPPWIWGGELLPVPIESIAENHYGVLVEERDSLEHFVTKGDLHVSGVLLRADGRILVDALEAARAPGRRRFTIGHELGHLVLHDSNSGPRVGRSAVRDQRTRRRPAVSELYPAALEYPPHELEANQFAAAMLMPTQHLHAAGIECPIELAELCRVSEVAAGKRLEYLRWRDFQRPATAGRDRLRVRRSPLRADV